MDRRALIEVLGVSQSPSTGEVRRARRRVARTLHPDAGGDSTQEMAEINAACDQWLNEIRARRWEVPPRTPKPAPSATVAPPTPRASPRQRIANNHGSYLATVAIPALVVLLTGISVAVVGLSILAVAAGVLIGLGLGGMLVVSSLVLRDRARNDASRRSRLDRHRDR